MGKYYCYQFKKVKIGIAEENNAVTRVYFGKKKINEFAKEETPLIKKTAKQIEEYLNGKRKKFTVPVSLHGTDFQISVWKALQTIPYGETRSYKDIAVQTGRAGAVRAVGNANHHNPVVLIVPCHRVINSAGNAGKGTGLGGFGGGIKLKKFLLDLEINNLWA